MVDKLARALSGVGMVLCGLWYLRTWDPGWFACSLLLANQVLDD